MIARLSSIATRRASTVLASRSTRAILVSNHAHETYTLPQQDGNAFAMPTTRSFFKASSPTRMPINIVEVCRMMYVRVVCHCCRMRLKSEPSGVWSCVEMGGGVQLPLGMNGNGRRNIPYSAILELSCAVFARIFILIFDLPNHNHPTINQFISINK
jgi:hypothetical protein